MEKTVAAWWEKLDQEHMRKSLERVNRNIRTKGILGTRVSELYLPMGELLTGYAYGEFYDWDLYFENIYMAYFGVAKYCRNNVEAFLDQQLECGFVARTLLSPRMRQHFKPFLAQVVVLGLKQGQNILWVKDRYYQRLKKYLDYWFWYLDFDKNGLAVWDSADHTGMDNQVLRAGPLDAQIAEGVDLNCYLYRELLAMEIIADKLGEADDARAFRRRAEELRSCINAILWDEQDGFYYDRNEKTGERIRYKSASSLTPLWAGVASEEQAKILIERHLLNPEEFWLEYPLASWAKNEEGYYQQRKSGECTWMGACWIPINYMAMHGLVRYGYKMEAEQLALKTFEMVDQEEEVREFYNAETGIGQGLNPFWGWSTLAYFMPLELLRGSDPTALNDERIAPLAAENFNLYF